MITNCFPRCMEGPVQHQTEPEIHTKSSVAPLHTRGLRCPKEIIPSLHIPRQSISSYSKIIHLFIFRDNFMRCRFRSLASHHDLHLDVDLQSFCLRRFAKTSYAFSTSANLKPGKILCQQTVSGCTSVWLSYRVLPWVRCPAFQASKRSSSIGSEVVPTSAIVISGYPTH